MNTTRNGKIARLPQAVREELNQRLEDGAQGPALLAWLNAFPAVQMLAANAYGGRLVSKQSLSEWRRGGYQDWRWRKQTFARAQTMAASPNPPVADHLAGCVTARYLLAIRKLVEPSAGGGPDLKTLRTFLHDVVAVRRGDHHAARMQMARERREDKLKETGGEL